jgi:hypothetical protein
MTAFAVALGLAACSTSTAAAALPHCTHAPAGIGPGAAATLQLADDGSTVCLRRRATLTVFLQAPTGEVAWSTPSSSKPRVLATTPNGALALPVGVTGAAFRARQRGVATLVAIRAPCALATVATCDAAHGWHARVVVH